MPMSWQVDPTHANQTVVVGTGEEGESSYGRLVLLLLRRSKEAAAVAVERTKGTAGSTGEEEKEGTHCTRL